MQHTLLKIKSAERAGQRWIEGWATTGSLDRQGDIVRPEGAEYSLPLILLFGHDHKQPIGSVEHATATSAGIRIRARLTPGVAKADELWTLLQDGAPLAMSIGFQALATEPLPGGGLRFTRWSWHELSIVAVGANPDARVSVGKGLVIGQAAPPAPAARKHAPTASADVFTETMLVQFGEAIGQAINGAVRPLHERIKALEAQKAMHYAGDWQEPLIYQPGAVVRHAGALHVLNREAQPGHAPRAGSAWQRIMKEL